MLKVSFFIAKRTVERKSGVNTGIIKRLRLQLSRNKKPRKDKLHRRRGRRKRHRALLGGKVSHLTSALGGLFDRCHLTDSHANPPCNCLSSDNGDSSTHSMA